MLQKFILLSFVFLIYCSSHAQKSQQSDSATIVQLLKADYATMSSMDLNAHLRNITDDYLLIEDGQIWDIKMETDSIYIKFANLKITRTDFFDIKSLTVQKDIAYTVYILKSEITANNNTRVKVWTESAIFRKVKGEWKIALVHSTPIKKT